MRGIFLYFVNPLQTFFEFYVGFSFKNPDWVPKGLNVYFMYYINVFSVP